MSSVVTELEMRISFLYVFVAALLGGCVADSNRIHHCETPGTGCIGQDSVKVCLRTSEDLGKLQLRVYEGVVENSIGCVLSVYGYQHSGDGVFTISIMRDDNELETVDGNIYTLRGENDETIWECRKSDDGQSYYFLREESGDRIFMVRYGNYFRFYQLDLVLHKDLSK